jgi:signal transduction histidine kinase
MPGKYGIAFIFSYYDYTVSTPETIQHDLSERVKELTLLHDAAQKQLRRMALELSLAEERERRAIAADLHDHLGQALAYIKMKLSVFAGNTIFCGFEEDISEISALLDQAISYTRSLTCEISPPLLYELGLEAALTWLAEDFQRKHKLRVRVKYSGTEQVLTDIIKVLLYKSVHELLTNAIKHAHAKKVVINISHSDKSICISVADDGIGFNQADPGSDQPVEPKFGLFSIKERLQQLGGTMKIESDPGRGTVITLDTPLR